MKEFSLGKVNIVRSQNDDNASLALAVDSLNLEKRLQGIKKVVIKINLVVAEPYDLGSVSDPFILEGIIKGIRKYSDKEIVVAEAETLWCTEYLFKGEISRKPEDIKKGFELALKNSGTTDVVNRSENVRILDVTQAPKAPAGTISKLVKKKFPKEMGNVDSDMLSMVPSEFLDDGILFINYNKMKTHRFKGAWVTLSCKNLFGFIPDPDGVPYHDGGKGLLNTIASINIIYGAVFENKVALVECLRYAIEGDGPDTEIGETRKGAGLILTGENFLELDTVGAYVMGADFKRATFLEKLESFYPRFDLNLDTIPEDFMVHFKQPKVGGSKFASE